MLHDVAVAAIAFALGIMGSLLVGALTVRSDLQSFRAMIPTFVTKEYLNEALKHERHEMRGEVQKYGTGIEADAHDRFTAVESRVSMNETRIRAVELKVARLTPPTKDETL